MYGRRRKFSKKPVRRMRSRFARKGSKVSTGIKRYVKSVIHKQIENKEITTYGSNITLQTAYSGGLAVNQLNLLLPVAQGTANNQRIGNTIKMVKGTLKGFVNIIPYNATTNSGPVPCWVRMILLKSLAIELQLGNPGELNSAIFKGNGTSLAWQGNMLDMCLQVNNDLFRVFADKKFKIGAGWGSGTGPVSTGSYFDNSPMSVPFFFNYGKYIKKILKFNDAGNSNNVQNDNVYLLTQVVNADGNANSAYPAEYHYVNYCQYEDA